MILHFQKEMNVIMYIIEFLKKVNLNHFIWKKIQLNMNFQSLYFCIV